MGGFITQLFNKWLSLGHRRSFVRCSFRELGRGRIQVLHGCLVHVRKAERRASRLPACGRVGVGNTRQTSSRNLLVRGKVIGVRLMRINQIHPFVSCRRRLHFTEEYYCRTHAVGRTYNGVVIGTCHRVEVSEPLSIVSIIAATAVVARHLGSPAREYNNSPRDAPCTGVSGALYPPPRPPHRFTLPFLSFSSAILSVFLFLWPHKRHFNSNCLFSTRARLAATARLLRAYTRHHRHKHYSLTVGRGDRLFAGGLENGR